MSSEVEIRTPAEVDPGVEIGDADLDRAAERLLGRAHRTPVLRSTTVDRRAGARVFFKCENFQKVGAFKYRGAANTLDALAADELARGVTTHSSGNHAQALALAAREKGVRATIVMPENAPRAKLEAVRSYGAEIVLCAPTMAAREAGCRQVVEQQGATLVHPYDDPRIVAGQSTAGRELLEEVPDLDLILAPVGGGGLVSGTALVARQKSPKTRVIACEPRGADDAWRSVRAGELITVDDPRTVADGLRMRISPFTFALIRRHVHDVVRIDDEATIEAMRFVWERMKLVIEPSAAVAVAVLFSGQVRLAGSTVGIILSGGNLDLGKLPWACTDCPRPASSPAASSGPGIDESAQ